MSKISAPCRNKAENLDFVMKNVFKIYIIFNTYIYFVRLLHIFKVLNILGMYRKAQSSTILGLYINYFYSDYINSII